jgi:hypothetical protein
VLSWLHFNRIAIIERDFGGLSGRNVSVQVGGTEGIDKLIGSCSEVVGTERDRKQIWTSKLGLQVDDDGLPADIVFLESLIFIE